MTTTIRPVRFDAAGRTILQSLRDFGTDCANAGLSWTEAKNKLCKDYPKVRNSDIIGLSDYYDNAIDYACQ